MEFIDVEKIDCERCENISGLKTSILTHGLLCPICLVKQGERYKVLSGRRRYNACLELGYRKIPSLVQEVLAQKKEEPPKKKKPPEKRKPVRKFFPKNIGFFTNTIDRAVRTLKDSGITAQCEKKEEGEYIEYNIKIPLNIPKN